MSVIVAKRKQSRLEYVSTSSDLLKYTIQRCLKLLNYFDKYTRSVYEKLKTVCQ